MPTDKKQQIIEATLPMLAPTSIHGITVPDIAKASGVAVGTFYRYFESKEELVNAIYQNVKNNFKAALVNNYPMDKSTLAQFEHLWQVMYEFASQHHDSFLFMELHYHDTYLDELSQKTTAATYEIGLNFIRLGQTHGDIREGDPSLLLSLFFGCFVQFFRGSCAKSVDWNQGNSDNLRKLCWLAITQ